MRGVSCAVVVTDTVRVYDMNDGSVPPDTAWAQWLG